MSAFYQLLDQQIGSTPIDPKDFAKYHLYPLDDRDSLIERRVKELKNKEYYAFEKEHLLPFCVEGKIKSGEASLRWMVFEDERDVRMTRLMLTDGLIQKGDERIGKFWIKEFEEKDINDLCKYGKNVISSGFSHVIDYFREWFVNEKYERIYKGSSTFEEYVQRAAKHKDLLEGKEIPFDLQKIRYKVNILLKMPN